MNSTLTGTAFSRRKGRLIVVSGTRWKWVVGKGGGVTAHSEQGERLFAWAGEVTGRDFGRGQWKHTSDGMVTPSDVAGWISRNN